VALSWEIDLRSAALYRARILSILSWQLPPDLAALAIFVIVTVVAFSLRYIAFRALEKWSKSSATAVDDIIVRALQAPSVVWCILIGMYSALSSAQLPPESRSVILNVVNVLLVVSVTAAVASLTRAALAQSIRKRNLAIPATGLSLTVVTVVIWIIGGLIVLSGLGVSITPLLTALGVGGLAVALALQETLSNFFAGLHLLIEKPLRVGDFVKLETGQEGYVEDIGWRTTRIRMLPNNTVIIPNNKITQSILTNYYLPETRMAALIPISVSYEADPDHVERVLLEEATGAIDQIPGLLAEPAPLVRFIPGFGQSSMDFTLVCQVREFTDQYLVQHELRKRIFRRFKEEGLHIPYPQRTVHLRKDSS
jgi:small-conductance mechanosensitive channel